MSDVSIEVFQDLRLSANRGGTSIRRAILDQVHAPWRHEPEREEVLRKNGALKTDVIALSREPFDDIDESGLVLWETSGHYNVANIVPRNVGQLSVKQYNAILQDFVECIAKSASSVAGFLIDVTPARRSLEDWLDSETVASLRQFSSAANKSTAAAHPLDQERWFQFLISAHRTSATLNPGNLVRWLVEVEGWPKDPAHDLALEYDFALALLRKYDSSRA